MNTKLPDEVNSSKRISRFAKRNYEIYKAHYKSRNLNAILTLDEFMENYRTQQVYLFNKTTQLFNYQLINLIICLVCAYLHGSKQGCIALYPPQPVQRSSISRFACIYFILNQIYGFLIQMFTLISAAIFILSLDNNHIKY